ncbi:cryptochrome/photolyase family protein [Alteromonas sp. KUL42]|uniref:cryptochrome/photolyase family protein n=1 Tax=Alteromonas sp. KUL42 TaxID=2480797 RepID=UPI0010356002|nr:cryptochrome/photolyase family protein [Alteromonas sp. KUL42]TAP33225.1 cryptochrome/photolyase family protein [Alteromonas sp. KUL42]GEA08440.1 cryptochrome/photolyase family protein [Alteromonas sp. KUL42]
MAALILVLGDQLTESLSAIRNANKGEDLILMAEVQEEATYVKHHKKKIAFLFSAMRHFAAHLSALDHNVNYIKLNDESNQGSLLEQVKYTLTQRSYDKVICTMPGEHRLLKSMQQWENVLGVPVTILPDTRFLSTPEEFSEWAEGKKQLRMEFFYREMRRKHNVLMDGRNPIGGKWNYDAENRESMPATHQVPSHSVFKPDDITNEVLTLVENEFSDHFGELDNFYFAVTREQALSVLETFLDERLENFGKFQDAMVEGKPWMYHSHIAFYLNCGLLLPKEVIGAAERAYHAGQVPLNSAEGFIRQILGWREYVRGFYWHFMPNLKTDNYFDNKRSLPTFYWNAQTNMNCMRQCIKETQQNAYAHHIQRLMVLGNFSLLTELSPEEVQAWYLLVYADAYEWVELPNVAGMILYSDGGNLASKPYVASGSYINKMSNYCKNCGYQVSKKTGPKACPFNYLYWHFIDKHKETLSNNPRMAMIYKTYGRMKSENIDAMKESALIFLTKLENNEEV